MRAIALGAVLLFAGCGPLFEGELAVDEICRDVDEREIPAAPEGLEGSWSWTSEWDPPVIAVPDEASLDVALTRVELSAASGASDLGFLEAASLQLDAADGAPLERIEWARPEGAPLTAIVLQPELAVELGEVIDLGPARATTSFTGTLPTQPWKLKVRTCYAVSARLEANVPGR